MGTTTMLYRIILLLHVATAIVGFGGLIAHSAYHAKAFRSKAGDANVILQSTRAVRSLAEYAIYAVLPLGIVLIAVSDDAFSMGEPWVSASFLVWFVMVGAIHGLVRPAVRTIGERAAALDPASPLQADPAAAAASKRMMTGEALEQLLLVVALILMIWQPGH
ncbi:MAG: DUF2269 family protein [Acidimicrobiales bacterium]